MPLLLYNENGEVYLTHYKPEELPKEMLNKGLLVDKLPAKPQLADKETAKLIVKDGKAIWKKEIIEKNQRRLRPEEKMDLILEKLEAIEIKLAKKE